MNYFTIARPYAIAAFYFASKDNKITEWQNMISFITIVSQDDLFSKISRRYRFLSNDISNILIHSNKNKLDNFQQNFIKIVIENSKLLILPYILKYFIMLKNIKKNTTNIEIISAYQLNDKQLMKILNAVEKKLAKKVTFNCKIDKSIIAGIIIKIGNSVINGSTKCCLDCFKKTLRN